MSERLDTSVDPSRPDDDEPDAFALWEDGDGELAAADEQEITAIFASIDPKQSKGFNPAEPRDERGRWTRGERLVRVLGREVAWPNWKREAIPGTRVQHAESGKTGTVVRATTTGHGGAKGVTVRWDHDRLGRPTDDPAKQHQGRINDPAFSLRPLHTEPGPTGDFARDAARINARQQALFEQRQDTESVHDHIDGAPGKYTHEREVEQQAVIDHFVNAPGVKTDAQLLVLGGLPGAGKTTFLNSPEGQRVMGGLDISQYVVVNPDEVKVEMEKRGMVPTYPGLTPEECAGLYHEESSMIAKRILRTAIAQSKNVAYDITLKEPSQLAKAVGVVHQEIPPPYKVTSVFIDVPIETAIQRAEKRYEEGGRYVPLDNIAAMADPSGHYHSRNRAAFEAIKSDVAKWVLVDNTNGVKVLGEGHSDRLAE